MMMGGSNGGPTIRFRGDGLTSWLSPRGRLSRRAYGRLVVRRVALGALLLCGAVWLGAAGLRLSAFAALAGVGLTGLASLPPTIRRLHDRDRTGLWLVPYLGLAALGAVPVERAVEAHPVPVTAYALASAGFSLWFLVETLGRRGTLGANRYGPEPEA